MKIALITLIISFHSTFSFSQDYDFSQDIFSENLVLPYFKSCKNYVDVDVCTQRLLQESIRKNLNVSMEFYNKKIGGKVFVKFCINSKGKTDNIEILSSFSEEINPFVIKSVKKTSKMIPGTRDGKPSPVYFTIPLNIEF
jgi:hypothetical protein